MNLHLNQETFKQFLNKISIETNIDVDILEKDYYVCCVLKELSSKQDDLKTYFKGGTAIYKILDSMNRFSEDIDLTVRVIEEDSKTQNVKRLKNSALKYNISGLELCKEKTIDKKGSITSFYKYDSVFKINNPLQRAGFIQIEATSFTVSEPYETYIIEPIIYKFANENEKNILKQEFDVLPFEIKIIKLERMFVDKIFATEFYYLRKEYFDTSKHLYDITTLFYNSKIQNMLKNKEELLKLINFKRDEEKNRIGGIDKNLKINNFSYFELKFNSDLENEFKNMQDKYIFKDEYRLNFDDVKNVLKKLLEIMVNYNF